MCHAIKAYISFMVVCIVILGSCAGPGNPRPLQTETSPAKTTTVPEATVQSPTQTAQAADQPDLSNVPRGVITVSLGNIAGDRLNGHVELVRLSGGKVPPQRIQSGKLQAEIPAGDYRVYLYAHETGSPILVEVKDVTVDPARPVTIEVNLLEGAGGVVPLMAFDTDGDMAMDRVELACGTSPSNPADVPGRTPAPVHNKVIRQGENWYKGDLHVFSSHGEGTESVKSLITRAEKSGLDFLAITDLHTMASVQDPDYRSDQIALIPAMKWGNREQGFALIYGPMTLPELPALPEMAQGECLRVQAQGGVFAIAHPCLTAAPWQWGLQFVNAVEVWFRGWRDAPPMGLPQLREDVKIRKDGGLVYSIAAAAATAQHGEISGNGQAALFWDYELNRGLTACAIGGSGSGSPKVPLGRPCTWVLAPELSSRGILEGLRLGRTFVTRDPSGPRLTLVADVMNDGKIDAGIGGAVPLNVDITLFAGVEGGTPGTKLQVLENGHPIRTVPINDPNTGIRFTRKPQVYSIYRVRVIAPVEPAPGAFGTVDVLALSSPIYAMDITQDLLLRNPKLDPSKTWIRLNPENYEEVTIPDQP